MNRMEARAVIAALALAASPAAASAQGDYKTATREEMEVPSGNGHVVLHRQGHEIAACTADDHLFLTYVFATTPKAALDGRSPLPLYQYSDGLKAAMKASVAGIPSRDYGDTYEFNERADLPKILWDDLESYSRDFNNKNRTRMDWWIREFVVSESPSKPCVSERPKR